MAKTQPLHRDFPILEFVAGTPVYVSKQGDLCLTVKAQGIEPGCKSLAELEAIEDGFRSAITVFDPAYRVQQTLFNWRTSEIDWLEGHRDPLIDASIELRRDTLSRRRLYQKQLYYTFIQPATVVKSLAMAYRVVGVLKGLLEQEQTRVQELLQRVESFRAQLANEKIGLAAMDESETKYFLQQFVRFQAHNLAQPVTRKTGLDYWIPNAAPHLHPAYVWHDGHYLQAVTVRDLPRIPDPQSDPDPRKQIHGSYAGIFKGLLDIDCPFLASVEWRQVPDNLMRNRLTSLHKNWDSKITSALANWTASRNDTRSDMRQDDEALAKRAEIGQAKVSLAAEPWGEYSYSVILHAPERKDVEAAVPQAFLALHGATALQEDQGTYDAWISTIPGNFRRNVRTLYAPISAAADTFLLWDDQQGSPNNNFFPDGKAFAILETEHRGVHYFAPNEGPVFGVEIFGQQGSGKTFVAGHCAENVARQMVKSNGQWVRPKMLALDMKDSYRENTLRHGGTYLQLSLDNPGLQVNPWSLPHSRDGVETIKRLMKILLAGDDGFVTTPEQDTRIVQEIEAKYLQKHRSGLAYARLRHVHLGDLQPRLEPWIGNGQYARFFDNDCDDLAGREADWLTIQFTGFKKHSHVLRPILYWHWERFMSLVQDPALAVPKLTLLDEAHEQMMMSPAIAERMLTGINTGRSYNLWNIFVMQWAHLLDKHPLGPALNAACPIKLFTASENIIPEEYARIFGMPLHVAQLIRGLVPRRELLRYSASGAQKLSLNLDAATAAIYANDVERTVARQAAIA